MTHTSRRSLLRAGIVGAALATLIPARHAVAATTTDLYSRSRFKKQLNNTFTLSSGTSSWPVTLTAISDLIGTPKGADNAFGLSFRSSTTGPPEGTYTLRRSGFTATSLFVVPGDATRRSYYAVVNRTA